MKQSQKQTADGKTFHYHISPLIQITGLRERERKRGWSSEWVSEWVRKWERERERENDRRAKGSVYKFR